MTIGKVRQRFNRLLFQPGVRILDAGAFCPSEGPVEVPSQECGQASGIKLSTLNQRLLEASVLRKNIKNYQRGLVLPIEARRSIDAASKTGAYCTALESLFTRGEVDSEAELVERKACYLRGKTDNFDLVLAILKTALGIRAK